MTTKPDVDDMKALRELLAFLQAQGIPFQVSERPCDDPDCEVCHPKHPEHGVN